MGRKRKTHFFGKPATVDTTEAKGGATALRNVVEFLPNYVTVRIHKVTLFHMGESKTEN